MCLKLHLLVSNGNRRLDFEKFCISCSMICILLTDGPISDNLCLQDAIGIKYLKNYRKSATLCVESKFKTDG